MALAQLRPARVHPPRAGGAGAVRHPVGSVDIERQAPAIGTLHPLRHPRRDPPAPELDGVAGRVSGVSRGDGSGRAKTSGRHCPSGEPRFGALTGFETALKTPSRPFRRPAISVRASDGARARQSAPVSGHSIAATRSLLLGLAVQDSRQPHSFHRVAAPVNRIPQTLSLQRSPFCMRQR